MLWNLVAWSSNNHSIIIFFLLKMLLQVWGKHAIITWYKFHMYFIIWPLYTVLWAHHLKSNLLPSPCPWPSHFVIFHCTCGWLSDPRKASLAGPGWDIPWGRWPRGWTWNSKRGGAGISLSLGHFRASPPGLVGLPLHKQPQGSGTAYQLHQGSKLRCPQEQGGSIPPFPDVARKWVSLLPHSVGQTVAKASPVSREGNTDPPTPSRGVTSKRCY